MKSTELQQSLFTAILQGNDLALKDICNKHADAILEYFPSWTQVPPAVAANPQAVQAWVHCLQTLATLFESVGIPDLMKHLTGDLVNICVRWQKTIARAKGLAQHGQYAASTELLEGLARELDHAQGNIVDDYRPKVYGLLGMNAFHLGHDDDAQRLTNRALEDCRRAGDASGVRVYTENLRVLAAAAATRSTDERDVRMLRIRAAIARAQDLSDDARFDQSNDALDTAIADIDAAGDGPGSEYAGKAYGLLGLNWLRLGDAAHARALTTKALEYCRSRNDADGVRTYASNLAHLDRLEKLTG